MALLVLAGPPAARAEDPEGADQSASPSATAAKANDNKRCHAYGPGLIAVGGSRLCASMGGSVLVSAAKEFTDRDIFLTGQRIPTLFTGGPGVPIVFYDIADVSKQTRRPQGGVVASAHLMLRAQSDLGLMRAFLRVTGDLHTRYSEDGDVTVNLRKIEDSYYLGAIEEAWIQWNGLKVGVQPSLFGFNRLPSVVTPGYTSIVTTMAAAYTQGVGRNASMSLSLEDSGRRILGDGILARPKRSSVPDIVAMARIATPNTLFHVSGVLHHVDDHVEKDFMGGREQSAWGWAGSIGLQSRVKWEDIIGPAGKGVMGRAGISVAYASGALGYLGIPFFAPDYITGDDGTIYNSTGWSALLSYEHMLTRRMKLSLNASFFDVSMRGGPDAIIPDIEQDMAVVPGLDFQVDVRGAVLQAGLEIMPRLGMTLGVEAGYTMTEVMGRYVGMAGERRSVGYPHIGAYLRQSF
jgi:hypothetical protein